MDATTTSILTSGTLFTIFYVLFTATFNLLMKKYLSGVAMVSLFWINSFAYLGYLIYYFFKKLYFRGDVYAIEELIHEYTFYNAPLYILLAAGFIGSFVMFNNLIQKYEISVIVGFSQINLLIGSLAVILFGGSYSWESIIGLSIIFIGAFIVPLKDFSLKNPLAPFLAISPGLMYNVFLYAALHSIERIVTFLLTQQTATTQKILDSLAYTFPFAFQNLFFFNIGSRFFITAAFLLYLWSQQQYKGKIFSTLKNYFAPIAIASVIYLSSVLAFQMAFSYTDDKLVLGSLVKLTVPTMIILGYLALGEKVTTAKIIGSTVIVLGGAVVLFL